MSLTSESNFNQQSNIQFSQIHRIITTLVESIPLSIGMKLRKLVYPKIFASIGTNVQIEVNVNFTRTHAIELKNGAFIRSGANLEVCGTNSKLSIGEKVRVDRSVDIRVHEDGYIKIGDRTIISPYTCISGRHISIGNDCLIAAHTGIFASSHNFLDATRKISEQGYSYQGITIEDDCWLGSGVKVLDGVTIGKGAVIGSGAVVTKNIPPYSIAVGIPAKIISQRQKK